jgi:hypothetical protein
MLGFDALARLALGQVPFADAPFRQLNFDPTKLIRSAPPQLLPINLNLYTVQVVANPFSQSSWPPSRFARFTHAKIQQLNLPLLANLGPFSQTSVPSFRARSASAFQPQNIALTASIGPFRQGDFGSPKILRSSPLQAVPFNLNLIANLGPFTQINWLAPQRSIVALALAPPNVPLLDIQSRPFANFIFTGAARARLSIPAYPVFNIPLETPVDTNDGVWVKRKRKKVGPDPIELELAEKSSRRAALELAIYGPEVEFTIPAPVFESPKPYVDVSELAKVIAQAQADQHQELRLKAEADEEADLESILREIL